MRSSLDVGGLSFGKKQHIGKNLQKFPYKIQINYREKTGQTVVGKPCMYKWDR
jgi:hypothetical protein